MLSLSTPWPELGWYWIISDVAYLAFIWGLWFSELYQTIVQGKRISPMHLPACSRRRLKVGFALGQQLNHAKEQLLQKCRKMKQEPNRLPGPSRGRIKAEMFCMKGRCHIQHEEAFKCYRMQRWLRGQESTQKDILCYLKMEPFRPFGAKRGTRRNLKDN